MMDSWTKVVFADDCIPCPDCGEPWCEGCSEHYSECRCLGPTQDGVEYSEVGGELFGRPVGGGVSGLSTAERTK